MIAALLFGCGVSAGLLGALFGLGGGVFLVPLLVLLLDLPIRAAVGTSLVAVIVTSAGVAAFSGRGRGADTALALKLELATAAGALAGGWLAGQVSSAALHLVFAAAVFGTALYSWHKARQRHDPQEQLYRRDYVPRHWPIALGGSSLAGMISGMLGVGGGFLKVPLMDALMGVPLGIATATSNFMVGITAGASVFLYLGRGDIHPLVVVPTSLGVFAGALAGVLLQPRLKAHWLRYLLILVLVGLGVRMMLEGIRG